MTAPNNFLEYLKMELSSIRDKGDFNSPHEAYGVLAEEVDEFWDEVKKRHSERDYSNMLVELVQISAVCAKAAESLGLTPIAPLTPQDSDDRIKEVESLFEELIGYIENNAVFGESIQKNGERPVYVKFDNSETIRTFRDRFEK